MKGSSLLVLCGMILLIIISPAEALSPVDRAHLLMEEGQYDRAIDLLVPLLNSDTEEGLSTVVEMLYSLYSFQAEKELSIQALETFIFRFPDSPLTPLYLYWVAKLEEDLGQHQGARIIYRNLIRDRLTADNDPFELLPLAYEDLARSLEIHQRDYPGAIEVLKQLLELPIHFEEKGRIMNQIAFLYETMNNPEQAKQIYRQVLNTIQACPARSFAALRLIYWEREPVWARDSLDTLVDELRYALTDRDLDTLSRLAKAGDFRFGVMYSMFEIGEFPLIEPYLAEFLPDFTLQSAHLEAPDSRYQLRIDNWPDPEYDILYLLLEEGRAGWEWAGMILSDHELETSLYQIH